MHNVKDSAENYLEAIMMLSEESDHIRGVDIATYLDVSRPSVSIAMKKLQDDGYVKVTDKNGIELTDAGFEVAKSVYHKHVLVREMLMFIGVPYDEADEDACKIEHILSDITFEKLKEVHVKHITKSEDPLGAAK